MAPWCLNLLSQGRRPHNYLRILVYWCYVSQTHHLLIIHCIVLRPSSTITTSLTARLLLVLEVFWRWKFLLKMMRHPWYPSIDLKRELSTETLRAGYPTSRCHVGALFLYTSSLEWHPGCDKISAPILVEVFYHKLWSIFSGVCADSLIHHISPLFVALASQILFASCTYSFANLRRFLHGCPTIAMVLRVMLILVHQTIGTLVPCFWI